MLDGLGGLTTPEHIGMWFSHQHCVVKSCPTQNRTRDFPATVPFSPALLFLVILRHPGQQQTLYTQPTSKQFLSQITRVCRIQLFWEQSEVTANQQSLKSNLSRHPLLMAYHIYLNISIHKMDDVSCCPFKWFSVRPLCFLSLCTALIQRAASSSNYKRREKRVGRSSRWLWRGINLLGICKTPYK